MEQLGEIEKRLWTGADTLRANSNFASNEYFLPVMGLIFLRHAYGRFVKVKGEIEASLPTRGGKRRALTKEDFSRKGAIFLREKSQFDYLVERPDSEDRAKAIIDAMTLIEEDYESLRGTLPKNEYQELDNDVLGRLLRIFNDPALKDANGDIFGRIYEYFLTQFADLKAHDGGEFFTPVSLVQMIVNVIEPDHGTVLDPACGSGGMFVQSAHFIEELKKRASEQGDILRDGKESDYYPAGEDEPGRAWARRKYRQGHHVLRRPARVGRQVRFRDGESAIQRRRNRCR
jgi:type I restriction enzyme M protein